MYSYASSYENSSSKGSSSGCGKNWKRFRRGTWRKSEVRKRWSMKLGRRAKRSFCITDGHMSFEKCWIGGKAPKIKRSSCRFGVARRRGPQGRPETGGGGLARIPNLRVCKHLLGRGVGHAGEEGWINILPWYRPVGVAKKPPVRRKGGRAGLPARVSGRHVVRRRQSSPLPAQQPGCSRVTGKAGENGQNSGEMGGSSPWTRPSAPECGDTLKALAGDQRPIKGGDRPRGSLSTGSLAGRTPPHGDDSMNSQANVLAGKVLRPPTRALPSVTVDTEKVLREADGSVKLVVVRPHTDGKVFAPGCASKKRTVMSRWGARRTQAETQANKIQKPNKKETTIERGNPLDSEIEEWLQEYKENLVDDEIPLQGGSHASSSHEASLEPTTKRREELGKHSVRIHFPKDRNCEICKRTKMTRAPCRRRNGEAVPRAEKFGDLITADHKVLSESCESRNNHRYAIVVQDLATQWIQAFPCKTKISQETQRSLQKFLEPETVPWNLAKLVKIFPGIIVRLHHTDQKHGIAERAVRRVKEGTSAVLLQSGLNGKWWADSMVWYAYLRNVTDLSSDGKTPYERRFGQPYSQANERVGKCAAAANPSVAVRDRGHRKGVAGSGWVRQEGLRRRSQWRAHSAKMPKGGWKGDRSKGAPQTDGWASEEPEDHERLCSIHWTRIISITNDSSKSHGYHLQIAWLRRTSSWRSICLYPGKNGGCSQIIENSQIGMSRHLDSSTTTHMA